MSVEVDNGLGTTMVSIGTLMLQKPAPAWDDETLRTAEHELARALGPMAKMIVRRAAAQTHDRAELCSILSDNIADPETRRRFVDAFNRRAAARPSTTGASGAHSGAAGDGRGAAHRRRARLGAACEHASSGRTAHAARAGVRRSGHRATRRVPGSDRAGRDEEGGARLRVRAASSCAACAENLGTQERAAFLREFGYEQ